MGTNDKRFYTFSLLKENSSNKKVYIYIYTQSEYISQSNSEIPILR